MKNYFQYLLIGIAAILIDQWTKWLVVHNVSKRIVLNAYIAFEQAINRGISWGLFNNQNAIMFTIITTIIIIITLALLVYLIQCLQEGFTVWGLTLVCAGSISNIIDRLLRGGVIDFIEVSWGNFVWPNFNIADMCIVIGIGVMIIEHYRATK